MATVYNKSIEQCVDLELQPFERCSISPTIKIMQIKTIMRYYFLATTLANTKTKITHCVVRL